jgi:ferritin-like metal-binding protein YciE
MHAFHDEYDKTTQNLIKGYGTENFEVAMYESLEAYAQAIGDQETVLLAQKHKQQEQEAADKIRPLISQTATRVLQNAAS